MAYRINLNSKTHDYTRQVAAILLLLRSGPRLANELPKFPSALIEAESLGLCGAQCIAHHGAAPSVWEWSITPEGKRWLKAPPGPRGPSTANIRKECTAE